MAENSVELEIVQGDDWTVDLIWTDDYDTGLPVVHPVRMEIKGVGGQSLVTLNSNPDLPEGEIPEISMSTNIGLIQLHLDNDTTGAFEPGQYRFDIFATVDFGTFPGPQQKRLMAGSVNVIKRTTTL